MSGAQVKPASTHEGRVGSASVTAPQFPTVVPETTGTLAPFGVDWLV